MSALFALDVAKLYAITEKTRDCRGMSWREVARETGISHTLFIRQMPMGYAPNAHVLITLLLWTGTPVQDVAIAIPAERVGRDPRQDG